MRTFEYSDAKSHKFWNIEVTDAGFTVTYGKIGTAGTSKTKTFPTPEKVRVEADKLVREKTSKGYVETTPTLVKSDREVMEEALRSDSDDRTAFMAYADLLHEQGDDVRSEFVRVQLELEDDSLEPARRKKLAKREKEILDAHQRDWLGPLAPFFLDQDISEYARDRPKYQNRVGWHRGTLRSIYFAGFGVKEARALIEAAERLALLRELGILETRYEEPGDEYEPGPDIPEDLETEYPCLALLARFPRLKQVRKFQFGEIEPDTIEGAEEYFNCHANGELVTHYVKQMPELEELRVGAHMVPGKALFGMSMPKLRVLQLYHSVEYPLKKLAENKSLSNLTHLLCYPHAWEEEEPYYDEAAIRALARSKNLPKLTHLQLRICHAGDEGVREIVESGLIGRLKLLDLWHGTVSDEGAKRLAAVPNLAEMELLDLRDNQLTDEGVRALEAAGVNLRAQGQHEADDEEWMYHGDIE